MKPGEMGRPWKPPATLLLLACFLPFSACARPVLTGLDVSSGSEHTLVMTQGSKLDFSRIVWDAGLPSERTIPGSFLGGYMFSVPPGAIVGNHPVALESLGGRRSKAISFNVTPPQRYGAPRIDAVMIGGAAFDEPGHVTSWLYVQGANIDVGAVVQVNGSDVASVAHKGLRNDLYGLAPAALGFPIYHYVAMVALPGSHPVGSTLSLTVRNLDGQVGPVFVHTLPTDAATLDSDGDDIPDVWEASGYDADGDGTMDISLPALGAHPHRRDILLKVDVMSGLTNPPIPTSPDKPGTFDTARAMFVAAPILNPFTESGINLIVDSSGTVPFVNVVGFGAPDNPGLGTANYSTIKAANFDNAKLGRIYHYAIWANAHPAGNSGESDIKFDSALHVVGPGDDFFISFDDFRTSYQTLRSQVETFTHELGHNLGQQHGGNDNAWYKPNYWSVMSYSWQLRTGRSSAWRRQHVTCPPAYYAAPGTTEPNGSLPTTISAAVDYSEGMAATLIENNNSLNEMTGVCGQPTDWNNDGNTTGVGINADVNGNDIIADTVTDFANWRSLDFRGPRLNGAVLP